MPGPVVNIWSHNVLAKTNTLDHKVITHTTDEPCSKERGMSRHMRVEASICISLIHVTPIRASARGSCLTRAYVGSNRLSKHPGDSQQQCTVHLPVNKLQLERAITLLLLRKKGRKSIISSEMSRFVLLTFWFLVNMREQCEEKGHGMMCQTQAESYAAEWMNQLHEITKIQESYSHNHSFPNVGFCVLLCFFCKRRSWMVHIY